QSGGHVEAGQPVLVGEDGPEVIVPKKSGTVVPNHALQKEDNLTRLHDAIFGPDTTTPPGFHRDLRTDPILNATNKGKWFRRGMEEIGDIIDGLPKLP